jgi:hypothetical protein
VSVAGKKSVFFLTFLLTSMEGRGRLTLLPGPRLSSKLNNKEQENDGKKSQAIDEAIR